MHTRDDDWWLRSHEGPAPRQHVALTEDLPGPMYDDQEVRLRRTAAGCDPPADNDEEAHCSVADLDQSLASRGRASAALHRDPCDLRSGQGWKQPYASEAAAGWSSKDISRSLRDTVD
jgi:hypothetical protein